MIGSFGWGAREFEQKDIQRRIYRGKSVYPGDDVIEIEHGKLGEHSNSTIDKWNPIKELVCTKEKGFFHFWYEDKEQYLAISITKLKI